MDKNFVVIEKISDKLELLEDELISTPTQENLLKIHHLKQNLIVLRKLICPFREVANRMERGRYTQNDERREFNGIVIMQYLVILDSQ